MKFSVIITVFNIERVLLVECVESVLKQSHDDIEIIIIDDGSTNEETLETLDYYKRLTDTGSKIITVLQKPNGGQGSARNSGVSLASGDYILFLDSDDYYLSDVFISDISELLEESKADVLSFQYKEFFDNNKRPIASKGSLSRDRIFGQPAEVALKSLLSSPRNVFSAATHTKVLRLGFMRENNIKALEGLLNEDIALTAMIIQHAKSYDRYDKVIYSYRRTNRNSISTQSDNSLKIAIDILAQFQHILSDTKYCNNKFVLDFISSPYIYWLSKAVSAQAHNKNIKTMQKDEIDKIVEQGLEYSYVLKYSSRSYVYMAGLLGRIFGMKCVMTFLKIYILCNRKHVMSINRKIVN
ncbi:MAG: glycosyltransferase family 2 protein [Oscillospiraceae bacterium]|nr:glycosyltransferase family 2 protein [Oscillospiraceae bacterium]